MRWDEMRMKEERGKRDGLEAGVACGEVSEAVEVVEGKGRARREGFGPGDGRA